MRKYALLLVLILGSCAGSTRPPAHQDNACSILDQRHGWLRDMQRSERDWGVPVAVQMATIWKESSFNGRAKPRRTYFLGVFPTGRLSSAEGYAQAVDGTWEWYQKDTKNARARRSSFKDSVDFIGWYMDKSRETLGIATSDTYNQYLAYHEGQAGYRNGSHRNKQWLLDTAREVEAMALRYDIQLQGCT